MSLLAVTPDIELPDGTFMHGPLLGSQEPRFWTAPPRHRLKDPDCRACSLGTDYACGCGDYKSKRLLDWSSEFYELDEWQNWWLTEACGTRPDGRWAAFETMLICTRQNGLMQERSARGPRAGRAVHPRRVHADPYRPRIQGCPGAFPPGPGHDH